MHQPYYEDLVTREHILPWVRLHALKDYYGMVALLEEFPSIRMTFNLVPSLLVQLEAFAADRAHDQYLELGMKPAESLSPEDVRFMLRNFFHAQRQHMIDAYPRYGELLALRGDVTNPSELESAVRRFSLDELRDLQVWQKLAWFDPYYLERDPRVMDLLARGRHFTEDDKASLRQVELDLLRAVIPAYRDRAAAGQIEISASPFYHPILPLLCDTDIYKHTHPHSAMPRHRFMHPEDAAEQLERAAACHERLFGARPIGLWPSEGSVSDAMIPLVEKAGFRWIATDELILARTLGTSFVRDERGRVNQPERLYQSYRIGARGGEVRCGFRDHALSDLIGFAYSGWDAAAAADHFVQQLVEAGRSAARRGQDDPTVFVILDGENAWEHFTGGGRPFLRALYRRLADQPELQTVTMAEACSGPAETLTGIFPGSWIDANFYIWIGHQDDHRGWSQLAEARAAIDEPGDVDAATVAKAREEVLIAEGSDWFWWYGDDHSSDHDPEFDDLFRRHLRNVYRLLQKPVPEELFVTNISRSPSLGSEIEPTRLIAPRIDGEESSYFEWLGAGHLEIRPVAGAMHQSEPRPSVLTDVWVGFDGSRVCLRVDGRQRVADLLAEGISLAFTFLQPADLRFDVTFTDGQVNGRIRRRAVASDTGWEDSGTVPAIAAGSILEAAIALEDLGARASESLALFVTVVDGAGVEVERHPAGRPVEIAVPDAAFEARNWSA
jgi:alpha-amylase/alpha-mannosidase (GH57 family)